jgi:hypothetical protein
MKLMKSEMRTLLGFLLLLPLSSADQKLTSSEARNLALAAMPQKAKRPSVTIEVDREQSGCVVYHAYALGGDPHEDPPLNMTFTVGWWSVDLRTAEVWDELNSKRTTNQKIDALQRDIRKRLRVTAEEISAAVAKPCYERYSR